jgi:hypothetical protein
MHASLRHGTGRPLTSPSEGRRVEDFFALKNPKASAEFEPANLGTKGQHATSRPPKPLCRLYIRKVYIRNINTFLAGILLFKNYRILFRDSQGFPIYTS